MFAEVIHQSAGVGVGVFRGAALGLSISIHQRAGRSSSLLLKQSVLFTALVAGMAALLCFALVRVAVGF